jgi:monoamine oxidase
MHELVRELEIETFPTYHEGRNLLQLGGKVKRYKGTIPRLAPHVLFDINRARGKLRRAAGRVPADAPWTAPKADELDSQTLASWVRKAARTKKARRLLEVATGTVMGTGTAELSALWMLAYVSSAGSFDALIDVEGGAQQDRFVGGSQLISQRLAEELADGVALAAPVRRIAQDGGGLDVEADGLSARAHRVIVAVPPPLAGRIAFAPSLGGRRDQLTQRMAHGALTKCAAVYPAPFWREEGLSGQAVSDRGPVATTFDNSPPDGTPGVLLGFITGAEAIRHARRSEADRRREVLECFQRLFGEQAEKPGIYLETAWAEEEWSRGGPVCSFTPGSLVPYGEALRQPAGRIHWAGAETATVWCGYMEGAVRSGERAAEEVLDAEGWRL